MRIKIQHLIHRRKRSGKKKSEFNNQAFKIVPIERETINYTHYIYTRKMFEFILRNLLGLEKSA